VAQAPGSIAGVLVPLAGGMPYRRIGGERKFEVGVMSTEQRPPAPARKPGNPFYFNTSEHLMRIGTTWCALEINPLQHASRLVIQKSLKEGFGLTVTEGLWKGKPTIAGAPSELRNSPSVSLSTGQTKESDIKRNGNQKSR
jgi:hypothetical protein